MTPDQIIQARRAAVLDHAAKAGVTELARPPGSRAPPTYRWVGRAERYGLAALLPKQRRLRPSAVLLDAAAHFVSAAKPSLVT